MPEKSPGIRRSKNQRLAQNNVFGSVLRHLRLERALTQEQLAWESGIERAYISELGRGLKEPGLGTVLLLSKALGLTATQLIAKFEHALEAHRLPI